MNICRQNQILTSNQLLIAKFFLNLISSHFMEWIQTQTLASFQTSQCGCVQGETAPPPSLNTSFHPDSTCLHIGSGCERYWPGNNYPPTLQSSGTSEAPLESTGHNRNSLSASIRNWVNANVSWFQHQQTAGVTARGEGVGPHAGIQFISGLVTNSILLPICRLFTSNLEFPHYGGYAICVDLTSRRS